MVHRTRSARVLFILLGVGLVQGPVGCSRGPLPLAPSTVPAPQSPPAAQNPSTSLVVFREPATGFSTSDLRDAHDRIIQLTNGGDLIWTPDGTHIPGYEISPGTSAPTYFIGPKTRLCGDFCVFSVRFGASNGERRAYVTIDYGHSNPGTLVDVESRDGALIVKQTTLYPPGTPTLFGSVTEVTANGPVPLAGAWVYRSVPAGWQSGMTDKDGLYRISGLIDGSSTISASKEGYETRESKEIVIQGDTRFDVQLVRR